MNLLINALQVETDAQNTHMLLGKLVKSNNYHQMNMFVDQLL